MAKKDINITSDINSVGSRSQQKVEREKALAALEKAKKQNRPIVFVKPGDGEFRRKLEKLGEVIEMLCTGKASAYIGISNYAFTRRMTALNIPHVQKGAARYFKVTDLDHYKEQLLNVQ